MGRRVSLTAKNFYNDAHHTEKGVVDMVRVIAEHLRTKAPFRAVSAG